MVVVIVILIPLAVPYLKLNSRLPDFERNMAQIENFSIKGGDLLRVPPRT